MAPVTGPQLTSAADGVVGTGGRVGLGGSGFGLTGGVVAVAGAVVPLAATVVEVVFFAESLE
ncbi:hypothetical protein GCM10010198_29800 [Nocardia seriolae]|nr:hypothetical protein NSERKGN1266_74140 [Nocardia seriolae]BEK92836.1 hypothetical protein NSER024013_07420 [Nocardia seriolae]GEM27437.1 hypothetical protein NS2_56760 [Nocardia seriolae NBRC 15557]